MARKPTPETQLIPGAVELDPTKQLQLEEEAKQELIAEQERLAAEQFKAAAKRRLKAEMQAANGVAPDGPRPARRPHPDRRG